MEILAFLLPSPSCQLGCKSSARKGQAVLLWSEETHLTWMWVDCAQESSQWKWQSWPGEGPKPEVMVMVGASIILVEAKYMYSRNQGGSKIFAYSWPTLRLYLCALETHKAQQSIKPGEGQRIAWALQVLCYLHKDLSAENGSWTAS